MINGNLIFLSIMTSVSIAISAGKSLEEMKTDLKKIEEKISKINEDWKSAATSSHALKQQIEEKCKIDYSAYKENGEQSAKLKTCPDGYFNSVQANISKLDLDQIKYEQAVEDLSLQFQGKLEEAKKGLDTKENFELLSYSNSLSNTKLKSITGKFKGEFVKSEFNRIKAEIEKSRELSLTSKAISSTLNSDLFCKAKENCESQSGQKISEADVNNKIIKGIAAKIAKEKINESIKPVSSGYKNESMAK